MSEGQLDSVNDDAGHDDADVETQGADRTDAVDDRSGLDQDAVPYDRFKQVNQQKQEAQRAARAAERRLQELTERLSELENRDQSEVEKARVRLTRAERERDELESRLTKVERQSWIRDAARDMKFDDPSDAVAFVSTEDVNDFEDALDQVRSLAKKKPRLLQQDRPAPEIGQVVEKGRRTSQRDQRGGRQPQQQGQRISPEDNEFLNELQGALSSAGWQSVPWSNPTQ